MLLHTRGQRGLKLNVSITKVIVKAKGDDIIETNITVNGEVLVQVVKY